MYTNELKVKNEKFSIKNQDQQIIQLRSDPNNSGGNVGVFSTGCWNINDES
jgi:hypothetical protein